MNLELEMGKASLPPPPTYFSLEESNGSPAEIDKIAF